MDLRTAIFKLGFKQNVVAKKAKCSPQQISDFIRGRNGMSQEMAQRIAKVLKCGLSGENNRDWKFTPNKKIPA